MDHSTSFADTVAWPEWFQYAEQMAAFTEDDQGNIAYPPEHTLTMDTSERNQQLLEEDGHVWDQGVITFDQDMKTKDIPVFELLDVTISSKNITVKVLQLMCMYVVSRFHTSIAFA